MKAGAAAVGGSKSKLGKQACLGSSRGWWCCAATMCSDGPRLLSLPTCLPQGKKGGVKDLSQAKVGRHGCVIL